MEIYRGKINYNPVQFAYNFKYNPPISPNSTLTNPNCNKF